jgi:diacylglycerol kinase family enzyme
VQGSKSNQSKKGVHRPLRAKLIFNPDAGQASESPQQLVRILAEMQNQNMIPEVFIVQPDCDVEKVVHRALASGIKMIVVAGGDGTIDRVAGAMIGRKAILGIIPIGTRNNIALNLGIGGEIEDSVALLRQGRQIKIDVGRVNHKHFRQWFLEAVALGLISDLYPMADEFQHGNLTQIGGLLSKFLSAEPSHLHITLDGQDRLDIITYMVLVTNMPLLGPNFQISSKVSAEDSRLDVFTFSDMSKLNMLTYAVLAGGGLVEEAGTGHYRVQEVRLASNPQIPVLADGIPLDAGTVSVQVHPHALTVMAGDRTLSKPGAE